MKYKTSPFQFWQLEKDYYFRLSKEEKEFLSKFENEFYNGNFKDYKDVKSVFNNSDVFKVNYTLNLLKDSDEWDKFKNKFIRQEKFDHVFDFGLQYFKRKCWNRKHKEREDVYAEAINGFQHHSYEKAHLDQFNYQSLKKNNLSALPEHNQEKFEDYYNDLQMDLIDYIKRNDVIGLVYKYVYYSADAIGNQRLSKIIKDLYSLYETKKLSKYKTFTYLKMFNNVIKEYTTNEEILDICKNINLIYDNYIYNSNNSYLKDLLK